MAIRYGGKSRTIGLDGPANADVVGYLKAGQGPVGTTNPGVRGMKVCAYPGNFNPDGSGDPAEHATGCDEDQLPVLGVGGEGTTENDGTSEVHGQSYLGFKVWNRRLLADAVFGVWGRWLEAGMTCPSLDFHDCTKPPPPGV